MVVQEHRPFLQVNSFTHTEWPLRMDRGGVALLDNASPCTSSTSVACTSDTFNGGYEGGRECSSWCRHTQQLVTVVQGYTKYEPVRTTQPLDIVSIHFPVERESRDGALLGVCSLAMQSAPGRIVLLRR